METPTDSRDKQEMNLELWDPSWEKWNEATPLSDNNDTICGGWRDSEPTPAAMRSDGCTGDHT